MTLYGYDGFDGADFGDMGEDYVQMGAKRKLKKAPRKVVRRAPAAAPARRAGPAKRPPVKNPRLGAGATNYHPLSLQQMGEEGEMGAFQMPNTKTLLMIGGAVAAAWYFLYMKK